MSEWPLRAATTEVASSGREVPTATMVSPITFCDTPKASANSTALSTTNLPPSTNPASPPAIIRRLSQML